MPHSIARFAVALGMLCAVSALPRLAWADEHALILWIGQYADPRVRIVGLERDAALARDIAQALGVPSANVVERSNSQLTHVGLKEALAELKTRVRSGDGVFVYFSGHGRQVPRVMGGGGCSEGLATFEGGIYFDLLLRDELDALAQRASRVVMFNDSCFSGGAVTKSFNLADSPEPAPKTYPRGHESGPEAHAQYSVKSLSGIAANDSTGANATCGVHINPATKAFGGLAQGSRQHGVLYLAGSAANEAAYPTPQGSVATRAWAACLQDSGSANNSAGTLTGAALLSCANAWIKRNSPYRQTITLVGNSQLPLRRF